MNEEILNELLPFFASDAINEEVELNLDGNVFKLSIIKKEGENKIVLTVEYEEDEFKKYVDSLDEDIFIESCEKFEQLTGVQLGDDVDKDLFKEVVNQIVTNKINKLKKFVQ